MARAKRALQSSPIIKNAWWSILEYIENLESLEVLLPFYRDVDWLSRLVFDMTV